MNEKSNFAESGDDRLFSGASDRIGKLLSPELIRAQVSAALEEDIGGGDLTAGLIEETEESEVRVVCREEAVACGLAWFNQVFRHGRRPFM